jgi:SAM-dependent methyltransferase
VPAITEGNAKQYGTSEKLAARARLHQAYSHDDNPWFPWVASNLRLQPGDRILDIGCGPAWFWEAAGDAVPDGIHLTLADLSPGMIEEAVARCRALGFASVAGVVTDASALPFDDASLDKVIAMHMLYHVRNQPGGTLAVATNDRNNLAALYALTTAFGSEGVDPAGAAFGFEIAETVLSATFGSVEKRVNPGRLRITEPNDVLLALTSYPPGDTASEDQIAAFRRRIDDAFDAGQGVLEAQKHIGLFLAAKPA